MDKCSTLCCTEIKNVSVKDGSTVILDDVSLHIHCGELTAIIGPNGAGKSTLLKTIIGARKHGGEIKFVSKHNPNHIIGYVPQSFSFDADSPVSVMDLFAGVTGKAPVCFRHTKKAREKCIQALKRVNCEELIDRKVANLSGGELQRVFLGLALEPVPNLLLLDEPVSGVDSNGIAMFWEILSKLRESYDLAIIIVSHSFSQVRQYADRAVLLDKKILACGSPAEVFQSQAYQTLFGAGDGIC